MRVCVEKLDVLIWNKSNAMQTLAEVTGKPPLTRARWLRQGFNTGTWIRTGVGEYDVPPIQD